MIILRAFLESYRSLKDKSLKLTFETNELSPKDFAELSTNLQYPGILAFKRDEFLKSEIEAIENTKIEFEDSGKSPSQRLKSVLFRLWESDHKGFETSEDHYRSMMEKIINHYKNLLP